MIPVAEWTKRIETWHRTLKKLVYLPVGEIYLEAFFTFQQLSAEKASQRTFIPVPAGTSWGEPWKYAWVRAFVSTPDKADGRRLCARFETGGEDKAGASGFYGTSGF